MSMLYAACSAIGIGNKVSVATSDGRMFSGIIENIEETHAVLGKVTYAIPAGSISAIRPERVYVNADHVVAVW